MSMKEIDNLKNVLGINTSNNLYDSSNVAANADGSVLERLEDLLNKINAGKIQYNSTNYIAVTADLSSATWNTVATHELFTVTGLVRMKVIAEVTVNGDDTSGDTSTIQLGTEDATNGWIAATQVDDLAAGEIWADATPTETNGNYSSLVFDKVVNAKDVGYEIANEAATAGTIIFHCWYEALNATGAVVAGDGSAMV